MKKIVLLFLFFSTSLIFSQETILFKKNDFKLEEDQRWRINSASVNLKNGNNKLSEVAITISCPENKFSSIDIGKINEIILSTNEKANGLIKNKYTYESKIIKLSFLSDSKTWYMTIEYTAQNDYGATKDGLIAAYFNNNYELTGINSF